MKTQELIKLQQLNIDMLDTNRNLISYLIVVYEKNGITHEEFIHAKMLLRQASKALQNLNKINHNNRKVTPSFSIDKVTEPNFTIVLYYALRKSRYNGIRLCCFTSSQATKRS